VRVVIAGGGTAGHVYPALALAGVLRDRGVEVSFLGTERGLEARLVPRAGFDFTPVPARPFPRGLSPAKLATLATALRAVPACRRRVAGAGVVVGMGGYVSVPAVLAAVRERVPRILHEQNAVPGLANRALSLLAASVALGFADARDAFPGRVRPRTVVTGNPVREDVLRVTENREALAKEARAELGLDEGRRTVVIFGGSQGALYVNRAAAGACRLLRSRADLQIVLLTGTGHLGVTVRGLPVGGGGLIVRPVGYLDRMDLAYACADLVVSRAGASSIAEVTACGLPALLVPYPHATDGHQEANARALQRAGGASILPDDQVTAESLAERIESLVDHDERLRAMAAASGAFGRPDAAGRLADLALAAAPGRDA
jgi:UDP-N-acetylglucosamine--N-acetylmuramyl-(pentapeptide) pyrophosphoryl-undecaprenol N-acetylglucosamine transferase